MCAHTYAPVLIHTQTHTQRTHTYAHTRRYDRMKDEKSSTAQLHSELAMEIAEAREHWVAENEYNSHLQVHVKQCFSTCVNGVGVRLNHLAVILKAHHYSLRLCV